MASNNHDPRMQLVEQTLRNMTPQLKPNILEFVDEHFLETELIIEKLKILIQFLEENRVEESYDRILRCVLYLSAANENLFSQYLELAKMDYRDIILFSRIRR